MSLDDVYRAFAGTHETPPSSLRVPATPCVVKPSRHVRHARHHKTERQVETANQPGPIEEINTVLDVLVNQVGRDLGHKLERQIRRTMAPMSRKARAELAAVIDDSFEDTESVQEGRDRALELLSEASPTEE